MPAKKGVHQVKFQGKQSENFTFLKLCRVQVFAVLVIKTAMSNTYGDE